MEVFADRVDAGVQLASLLTQYKNQKDVIVLALPRGGVPVAYEVAKILHAPLDVFIVRKIGAPMQKELALGAIAMGGVMVLNDEVINLLQVPLSKIERIKEEELIELKRREKQYRGNKPLPNLKDKTIILVDDGIATGATVRAAIAALKQMHPSQIIVAVPVADIEICRQLEKLADKLVCVRKVSSLNAVGLWYQVFDQTSDEEVKFLLNQANHGFKDE